MLFRSAGRAAQSARLTGHPGGDQRRPVGAGDRHPVGAELAAGRPRVDRPGRRGAGHPGSTGTLLAPAASADGGGALRYGGEPLYQRSQQRAAAVPPGESRRAVHLGLGVAVPEQLGGHPIFARAPARRAGAGVYAAAPAGAARSRRRRRQESGDLTAQPAYRRSRTGDLHHRLRGERSGPDRVRGARPAGHRAPRRGADPGPAAGLVDGDRRPAAATDRPGSAAALAADCLDAAHRGDDRGPRRAAAGKAP